jgi:phosphoribosyl 1,2-cyclic phosphodiesterase
MSDPGCTLPSMSSAQALRVVFLGSGSGGNATAVTDGTTTLLIDCGFSAREVSRRLALAGLAASDVSAVLVTHEHSDHIRGVEVFQRRHGMAPVACTTATRRAAGFAGLTGDCLTLAPGEPTRFGTLTVLPFRTSHDAAEPVGFRIESDAGGCFGLATDTGYLTDETAEALLGVDILGIESNHDLGMLENGPYPYCLKRRIRSERGHLSNADACEALTRLASDRLTRVFALHRSNTNNSASIVERELRARAVALGLSATVEVAMQSDVLDSDPAQGTLFAG